MAGRRGNEAAAAEGGPENFPGGEKLLQCLRDRNLGLISVRGFEGMGRWSIAKYAARKSTESHLFEVQIFVELLGENFSLRKAQKEIACKLGITTSMDGDSDDEEESIDTQVATKIYNSLIQQKFLLVLGDVPKNIDFELIGNSYFRMLLLNGSKIVLVGPNELQSDMAIKLDDLPMEEEAADIAGSPSIRGHFNPNTVLDCLFYMLLFWKSKVEVEKLKRHWRAEGFIITEDEEEEEAADDLMMYDKVEALLTVLQLRSMVQRDGKHVRFPSSIYKKLLMMKRSRSGLWKRENLPTMDSSSTEDIRRMTVYGIQGLLPLPPKCPNVSALHLLGNRENDSLFRISDDFFEQMKDLRVLKLKRFGNEYLPKSASCLHHLKVLKLERCPHLHTLLPSLQNFDKLEYLELSYEGYDSNLTIPDDLFQHMNHLQFLYLNSMQITSLPSSISMLHSLRHLKLINCKSLRRMPDEIFGHLSQLRILELRGNVKMESLPSLLFNIVNLKKLIIRGSSSLKMRFLPHLQKLSALEVLDLESCSSFEDIADVTSSLGKTLPNLRKLYISNTKAVRRLDLKGCQSLESVSLSQLTSLKAIDLSGTKFKTLPQGISDARVLRHLDMLNMNEIRKISWNDISTTLEELNLSQCSTWNSSNDVDSKEKEVGLA